MSLYRVGQIVSSYKTILLQSFYLFKGHILLGELLAKDAFKEADVNLHTLTDFKTILTQAEKMGILNTKQVKTISDWLNDPWNWAKKHGFEAVK